MRMLPLALGAVLAASCVTNADVVVQRWGVGGHVQHPKTLAYRDAKNGGRLMLFTLSALPAGVKVHRARLVIHRSRGGYGSGFAIVPGVYRENRFTPAGGDLELVPPWNRWFDATDAARKWSKMGWKSGGVFLIRKAPRFNTDAAFLEIAYEGRLADRPKQVGDVKAFYRAGQVFITFREIEDLSEGHDDYPWGHLIKKSRGYKPEMLGPRDDEREVRHRVYRHDKPITRKTIGDAELLAEVVPGSRFNTRQVQRIWRGEQVPSKLDEKFVAVRLAIEPEKPLRAGIGRYVHTVRKDSAGYYAVVASVNGVENTIDLAGATAGPIRERVAPPEPVVYRKVVSKLRGTKDRYVQLWCNYYCAPPLSRLPMSYDVVIGYCEKTRARPAPVHVNRGHAWIVTPEPNAPRHHDRIDLSHCSDDPNAFWMGVNDAYDTLKGVRDGKWQPFPQRRQEALLKFLDRKYGIDWNNIVAGTGCWGMMEFERPDLYASLHGWGLPEVTKGFQAWNRATGVWGGHAAYAHKPNQENPYWRQDYSRYALADPKKETPFFQMHMGWGAHFTEMGWPSLPRFYRAMITARRPFVVHWQARNRPSIRRNQSVPALGNCSIDDMPGNGDRGHGGTFGAQINAYLTWDSKAIVDRSDRWEMTVILDNGAPLPECTVDITPRRCQEFKPRPGERFKWTNTSLADKKVAQSGRVTADKWGLATLRNVEVTHGKNRIRIQALK